MINRRSFIKRLAGLFGGAAVADVVAEPVFKQAGPKVVEVYATAGFIKPLYVSAEYEEPYYFANDGVERMRISSDGRVGVGIQPEQKLDIKS